MMSQSVFHIGLGLLKSTGGTTKAVEDFEDGLPGSRVVALCSPTMLAREGPARAQWEYLPLSRSVLGRFYESPDAGVLAAWENRVGMPPDAIFCHMLYRGHTHVARAWACRWQAPYFVVPHGSLDPWVFTYRRWQKKGWLAAYGRRFLADASAVIFATQAERRKASEVVSTVNSVVIPWPVQLRERADLLPAARSWRQRVGISAQARMLVMFGRVHSCKRPLETIRAVAQANAPNLHLMLVGPECDVSRSACEKAARPLGARFHWIGPIYGDEKFALLAAADGYISMSEKENFNYCLAECLGLGLPAIVSMGNDLSHELRAEGCGWMLDDDREGTATRAVYEFAHASSDALAAMGDAGRRFVRRELAPSVFSHRLQALVAASRRPSAI